MNYQQDDWSTLLLLTEFTYNNANNESTRISPFFANKGYHPALSANPNLPVPSAEAQQYVAELDNLHAELKRNIRQVQSQYQKNADHHCSLAPPFKLGDWVYVKAKYFRTTQPSCKLAKKNLGPYKIISTHGNYSFTL